MNRGEVVTLTCEVVHVGAVGHVSVAHNAPENRVCVRLPDDRTLWIDAAHLSGPPEDKAIRQPPETQHVAGPRRTKRR